MDIGSVNGLNTDNYYRENMQSASERGFSKYGSIFQYSDFQDKFVFGDDIEEQYKYYSKIGKTGAADSTGEVEFSRSPGENINNTDENLYTTAGYDVQMIYRDGMDYVIYVPKDYDSDKEYTLVMYQHGTGEYDINNLNRFNQEEPLLAMLSQMSENGEEVGNMIIVAPLRHSGCDNDRQVEEVKDIANEICSQYNINQKVMMGYSAGAVGALYAASKNDDSFYDKIVIMSAFKIGRVTDEVLEKIKTLGINIFGFSGDQGKEVDKNGESITKQILEATGNADNFILIEGAGHGDVPNGALKDSDGNGHSDLFEVILN